MSVSTSTISAVFAGLERDLGLVDHRHAVARIGGDRLAVAAQYLDLALGRHEIGGLAVQLLADRLACLQRAGKQRAVGVERDRALVTAARGQRHQLAVASVGRKLHRLPARRHALLVGQDPDLEQLGLGVFLVVLGVLDAIARAHHLDLARFGAALVAEMVLMRDRAFDDVGHDLHVAVGMRREARVAARCGRCSTRAEHPNARAWDRDTRRS